MNSHNNISSAAIRQIERATIQLIERTRAPQIGNQAVNERNQTGSVADLGTHIERADQVVIRMPPTASVSRFSESTGSSRSSSSSGGSSSGSGGLRRSESDRDWIRRNRIEFDETLFERAQELDRSLPDELLSVNSSAERRGSDRGEPMKRGEVRKDDESDEEGIDGIIDFIDDIKKGKEEMKEVKKQKEKLEESYRKELENLDSLQQRLNSELDRKYYREKLEMRNRHAREREELSTKKKARRDVKGESKAADNCVKLWNTFLFSDKSC